MNTKTLTKLQKDFILDEFFKNEEYAGWRNIAESLLNEGYVTTTTCSIWSDNITNFMNIVASETNIGCYDYEFDIESFLVSEMFVTAYKKKLTTLKENFDKVKSDYEDFKVLSQLTETLIIHNF